MMAGNSNLDVLVAQATTQGGENQYENNRGTVCEAAKQEGPSFMVPKGRHGTGILCSFGR
jgi:hypothetical protein